MKKAYHVHENPLPFFQSSYFYSARESELRKESLEFLALCNTMSCQMHFTST